MIINVSISLPEELIHVLKILARMNRRSLSSEIRKRLESTTTKEEILSTKDFSRMTK